MSKYKNSEGYSDETAGIAIQHVSKIEKKGKKDMSKIKNCRLSADEKKIHEKAVKMRKMTDEQLVDYVEQRVEQAQSEGFNRGKKKKTNREIFQFIEQISGINGIGRATTKKIRILAKSMGYVSQEME